MNTSTHDIAERTVTIPVDGISLQADLVIPDGARGIVLFAHGSGSGRRSPRNRAVAAELQRGRLATLLLDLLTVSEEEVDAATAHLRFDIPMLATRLATVTKWVEGAQGTKRLRVGYFGASTGAAAALVAAAALHDSVHAVVSRGGRPDLAGRALAEVRAPTLLIVGALDTTVLHMNRDALRSLHCPKELAIVPGATHLFEEPGTLDQVAALARDWFQRHLADHRAHIKPSSGW